MAQGLQHTFMCHGAISNFVHRLLDMSVPLPISHVCKPAKLWLSFVSCLYYAYQSLNPCRTKLSHSFCYLTKTAILKTNDKVVADHDGDVCYI